MAVSAPTPADEAAAPTEEATATVVAARDGGQAAAATVGRARAGRNEWLLVLFTVFTNLADAVTKVALPLLAARISPSPGPVAAVAVLLTLPWLVTALHVGVLVDRVNRRTLMVAAETARITCVAGLLAAVLAHVATLPLVYVVALGLGVAEVVALTSAAAVVPAAVPRERWQAANARISAMENLCNGFLGAPVGGFLVAAGFALALGVTGLVYAGGVLLLVAMAGDFAVRREPVRRTARADIGEGLRFLLDHRLLRTMALLIAGMSACWSAWLAVLPAYAVAGPLGLDERQYGLLLTALGAGGVLGAVVVGPVNRLLGRRWSMFADVVGSFLLVAVTAVAPASGAGAVLVGAAAFAAGLGGTMWTVNSRVVIQSVVPEQMLGRFSAASRLVGWGMTPVAALAAGLIAQAVGYRAAFGAFAVVCAALVYPFLRVVTPSALAAAPAPE